MHAMLESPCSRYAILYVLPILCKTATLCPHRGYQTSPGLSVGDADPSQQVRHCSQMQDNLNLSLEWDRCLPACLASFARSPVRRCPSGIAILRARQCPCVTASGRETYALSGGPVTRP